MQQVVAYQTGDGKLFFSQSEAETHEFYLKHKEEVDAFLDSNLNGYKGSAQRVIASNSIIAWERFKARRVEAAG